MISFRGFVTGMVVVLVATPAAAIIRHESQKDPRWLDPERPAMLSEPVDPAAGHGPVGQAAREFLSRRGGTWQFREDPRTGFAALVQGDGIALIPGRGNSLGKTALEGLPTSDGEAGAETLRPLVESFLEENRSLLGPPIGRLVLDEAGAFPRDGGRLYSFNYAWHLGDVPVEGAGVFVRINSGNITQFGSRLVGRVSIDTTPAFDGDEAARILLGWSGDEEIARLQGAPRLIVQPEDGARGLIEYRLVWIVTYRVGDRIETWEGRVDAHTGRVVGFRDTNAYGRVTGGIFPRTVADPEIRAAFPDVRVDYTGPVDTDTSGFFSYGGGDVSSGLNGVYFNTNCESCTNPAQPAVSADLGIGLLDFGVGGSDGTGNGLSTRADRNSFYHLSQVRRIGKKWLPSLGWLNNTITSNVNILNTCNAVYTGAVNFYRSGNGCNNTGEISDVMHHEWGHGLDGHTLGGDGATGEGTGDVVAIHMSHDAKIGPYFQTNGNPVRNVDSATSSRGLLTRSNIGSKCPTGSGPLGYEVHCEGELYGQAAWDLAQALVGKHGQHTGWRTSERIFFTSLPDAGSYLPEDSFAIYTAYLNADDDDGNLMNGTPNAQQILGSFAAHEIAGNRWPFATGCPRPAQPSPMATPVCDRIDLSWSAVPGIDHYEILRGEVREDSAFFPMATVASTETSWTDTEVAPGVDYWYTVMAVDGAGCESTVENPAFARLPSQPILAVVAVQPDDEPRGNRSGFADPGEEVDLHVTLGNFGDTAATAISGTLSAETPGVTILDAIDTWPPLAAGGAGEVNEGVLRFVTDDLLVSCGDTLLFRLVPDEASGCPSEHSYFEVLLGELQSMEGGGAAASSWVQDEAESTATTGHWTFGAPDPTEFQPDGRASSSGERVWFTAPNHGKISDGDVDSGVTVLVSPPMDLSARGEVILSYDRWFANRDRGEDPNDYFAADVSPDGGATWVNLETLGTNDSAPSWTHRRFRLGRFVPLTGDVRIRFRVSDGPDAPNLVEAALGGMSVEQVVCDTTPACFTEADFAGAESAVAGDSCGETVVTWQSASSFCQNATVSYNVYRSTDPDFVPAPGNLVASGLVGTSFQDSQLPPGGDVTYVVRAHDSRSGEESNLVRRSVTAPSSPDIRAPLFAGLQTADPGGSCGETALVWAPALEVCSGPVVYEVHRSTDPGFLPSQASLVAVTLSTSYVDAALAPGTEHTYVVRARDAVGNVDSNLLRSTVVSAVLDDVLLDEAFESGPAGWLTGPPNDAATGEWEWGDPQGTGIQSEDDHTPAPGAYAWVTGLAAQGSAGGNDVDDGITTLLSASYDLSGAVAPAVRYARWFTNDQGSNPGEDPLRVDYSLDGGANWNILERVQTSLLDWVVVEYGIPPSANTVFRFQTEDLPGSGSLVEAAIDDFEIFDPGQGCDGCTQPAQTVGTILVSRSGDDVVIDWTADPVSGERYLIYHLSGSGLSEAVRVGSTDARTFVHEGALLVGDDFYYRVTAVDACGAESDLE